MKRALVISGGGSLGSWGAGFIAGKTKIGYSWDEYYGTSTGALVATIASLESPVLLKEAFTTMGNADIWSRNPFNKKGKIKKINLVKRVAYGKEALGSTCNLRKNLEKFYTEEDHDRTNKEVIACVTNYTKGIAEYGRNDKLDYDTFLDYVWASTCVPVLCNGVNINGSLCQDGGVLMNIPIQQAINNGCDEIDILILKTKDQKTESWKADNMIDIATRSIEMMHSSITDYAIIVPQLNAKAKKVKLRFRYMPENLASSSFDIMNFDKEKMADWFDKGLAYSTETETSDKIWI